MTRAIRRYERVLATAVTVVPGPRGSITFVHQARGPYAGSWLLPGGGIEVGETAAAAARREVAEETGCSIPEPRLFAVYELLGNWREGDPYQLAMFAFLSSIEVQVPSNFKGHNVAAVRQAAPEEMTLHSTDMRILTDAGVAAFSERSIETALAMDGIRMLTHLVHSAPAGSSPSMSAGASGEAEK